MATSPPRINTDDPALQRLGLEVESPDCTSPSGVQLLEALRGFVLRYVVLSDEQAAIVVLWIVHTHAVDAADATPYLNIFSAEKRSGKTRLLEVLSLLAAPRGRRGA